LPAAATGKPLPPAGSSLPGSKAVPAGTASPAQLIDIRPRDQARALGSLHEAALHPASALLLDPRRRADPPLARNRPTVLVGANGRLAAALAHRYTARGRAEVTHARGGYRALMAQPRFLIPDYPNRDRLLPWRHWMALLAAGSDIRFIDTRPRAIHDADSRLPHTRTLNLPVAEIGWAAARERLEALDPATRYIGLGFDQQSSHQAMRAGLILTRAGRVWLGLNTTPHLYSAGTLARRGDGDLNALGDVAAAAARIRAREARYGALSRLMRWSGLPGAAFLLALGLGLRGVLAPLSYAARRAAGRGPGLAANLALLAALIGAALTLQGWLLTWPSVQDARLWGGAGLLAPDPWHLLPALTGLVIALHLALDRRGRGWRRAAPALAGGGLATLLLLPLSAGLTLYVLGAALGGFALHLGLGWASQTLHPAMTAAGGTRPPPPRALPLARAWRYRGLGPKASWRPCSPA